MFKRKRLIVVCLLATGCILFFAAFIRGKYVVPIVMYHSVNPAASRKTMLVISPETFERQMRFLQKHRYNVITLSELADLITNNRKIPPRTIVITLDDGYRDNYTYAFPILKKYNIPATVFIITDEVGRPQGDRLGWEDIKRMQDSGLVTVGSHTLGPEPLINIRSAEEIRKQIFASKQILEQKLGRQVDVFSYPEGGFNANIRQLVIDAGYKAAVATNPGKNYPDNDVFALKRLRISENAANMFIFWVETSGYYTFMKESKR
ncbi:MAG: polysaccharide deacetylase family protein [Candidatus Omnitrophica bacterium]|nr:polysaccharide deacetylase family protein [Candidatus Omnitrophota bacterium]